MTIGANGRVVQAATKELALKWEQTRESWADAKSQEFERDHLADLITGVEMAGPVFEKLDKLVNKVRSDCE